MKVGPGLQVVFLAFTLLLCSVHTARGWSEHSLSLPRRNCLPSNSRPFVFLHQRKTGGSSLRQEILFAGLRAQLSAAVACLTGTCFMHSEPEWPDATVVAGHLTWGRRRPSQTGLSCLTVFREPVERISSCYYYAMKDAQPVPGQPLSAYTPDELRQMFTDPARQNGEGCINEPIRIFSGVTDQSVFLSLQRNKTLHDELVGATKRHVAQCLILMTNELSHASSHNMLTYWFPWLTHGNTHLNSNPAHAKQESLSPAQEAVLRELASAEFEVWEWAKRRYEVQKAFINSLTDLRPRCLLYTRGTRSHMLRARSHMVGHATE